MDHKVIARRWRPKRFDEVVGQEHITGTLRYAVREDHIAPVYLFTGIRGTGKTSLARILVKSLNCLNRHDDGEPCNECENCCEITQGKSPDIIEIDGASNNSVDDVRNIKENIIYGPVKSRFKVYIIDEVHMLSKSAFNALLKTLEEPPSHALFILATTDPQKIPTTVRSRCQRYDLRRISLENVVTHLAMILESEKVEHDREALHLIAAEGEGSMRDSQTILEQLINFGSRRITAEEVAVVLGTSDRQLLRALITAITDRDKQRSVKFVHDIYFSGGSVEKAARDLLMMMHHLVLYSELDDDSFLDVPDEEKTWVRDTAARLSSHDWMRLFRFFSDEYNRINESDFSMMLFETAVLMACDFPAMADFRDMLALMKGVSPEQLQASPEHSADYSDDAETAGDDTPEKEHAAVEKDTGDKDDAEDGTENEKPLREQPVDSSEKPVAQTETPPPKTDRKQEESPPETEIADDDSMADSPAGAADLPHTWEGFVQWLRRTDKELYGPTHNIPYEEDDTTVTLRPSVAFESIQRDLPGRITAAFTTFFGADRTLDIATQEERDGDSVSDVEEHREAERRRGIRDEIQRSEEIAELEQMSFSLKKIVIDDKKEPLE